MKIKSSATRLISEMISLNSADKVSPLHAELNRLAKLIQDLEVAENDAEKIEILDRQEEVKNYFSSPSPLRTFLAGVSKECEYAIKAVIAIKQGKHLFHIPENFKEAVPHFHHLISNLLEIENFYRSIGGVIGYQCLALSLLPKTEKTTENFRFLPPEGVDLSKQNASIRKAILEGIRLQGEMAEIYPVGGAADRLELKDENTGVGLPAACLVFQGKHLLEGVVCDLQAREYLHFKLFNQQILTPLALMTSEVNQNHELIQEICKKNRWFGRPQDYFKFFIQPSIPTFNRKGNWCLKNPLELLLKPGGHGVIWKLAEEKGIFDWLKKLERKKALIRQINNPMAAVDYGLSAFLGIGHLQKKVFGFASCERRVNAHEGMNVLKILDDKCKVLTNVEYCDFKQFGIDDKPRNQDEDYSLFPSNTNILFVELESVREAAKHLPFPGLLANFRMDTHYDPEKNEQKEEIARLETTMQNIADAFEVSIDEPLPTYLTFNERRKTISTTKKKTVSDGRLLETPEGCFYDFMQNAQELLGKHCGFVFSSLNNETAFLRKGPPFLMSYHPALGPFYSIIQQKLFGGEIHYGSELQLEIADLEIKDLFLDGSLLILSDQVMGHFDEKNHLIYSNRTGQCILKNVRIENEGIDWLAEDHLFWKHDIKRTESLEIILKGHSRFEAENVIFKRGRTIVVPDGVHLIAKQKGETVIFESLPLDPDERFWNYSSTHDAKIVLIRKNR